MPPEAAPFIVTLEPLLMLVAEIVDLFSRPDTTTSLLTVTVAVAFLPFEEEAVIVAVPTALPVTTPFDTEATDVSLEDHVTDLSVAFEGATEALNVTVAPTFTLAEVLSRETPVTST